MSFKDQIKTLVQAAVCIPVIAVLAFLSRGEGYSAEKAVNEFLKNGEW